MGMTGDRIRDMMSPELLEFYRKQGSKGGKVGGKRRAAALTPERRSEIARKAAQKRWGKTTVARRVAAKKLADKKRS